MWFGKLSPILQSGGSDCVSASRAQQPFSECCYKHYRALANIFKATRSGNAKAVMVSCLLAADKVDGMLYANAFHIAEEKKFLKEAYLTHMHH